MTQAQESIVTVSQDSKKWDAGTEDILGPRPCASQADSFNQKSQTVSIHFSSGDRKENKRPRSVYAIGLLLGSNRRM